MESVVINTRADLDALTGTPEHTQFMASLRGTLWRLEKDDVVKAWAANEDNSTIARFGFTRADFAEIVSPAMPVYVPPPSTVPQTVSRLQARMALHLAGLLPQIEALMTDPATDMLTKLAWQDAQDFRRNSPTVAALAVLLDLDSAQLDALFVAAQAITA